MPLLQKSAESGKGAALKAGDPVLMDKGFPSGFGWDEMGLGSLWWFEALEKVIKSFVLLSQEPSPGFPIVQK